MLVTGEMISRHLSGLVVRRSKYETSHETVNSSPVSLGTLVIRIGSGEIMAYR